MRLQANKEYFTIPGAKPAARSCKMDDGLIPDDQGRVRIAVFDFDRTCIDGRSPLRLTAYLVKTLQMRPDVVARMLAWGACYKLHLPQNESWVRQLVFKTFVGKPKERVDKYLGDFYDNRIDKLFHPEIDRRIRQHREQGCFVITVSATFEPMLQRMLMRHPFHDQISTRMKVDADGNYTNQVDGLPVEGDEKVSCVIEYADKRFGKGNWEIEWAYSDHYSDRPLLGMAKHPVCVNPDSTLRRTAKKAGWEILEL